MKKNKKDFYPIHQSPLYKCHSKKKLLSLLNIEKNNLFDITKYIDKHYKNFKVNKNNTGKKREVNSPDDNLKKIQRRLLKFLSRIERPSWVMAGSRGKSYIDNAAFHRESKYICKMDIKQFYNNCKRDRVYRFFSERLLTSPDIAKILTDLTTLGNIPTGTPTSQLLAYFSYEEMFENIVEIGKQHMCKTTLYVDDIVFSSNEPFKYQLLANAINIEVRRYDHRIKENKTKYYSTNKGAVVTGVILKKGELKLPNQRRKDIIDTFSKAKAYSVTFERDILSLRGKISAARQIDKKAFNGIKSYIDN